MGLHSLYMELPNIPTQIILESYKMKFRMGCARVDNAMTIGFSNTPSIFIVLLLACIAEALASAYRTAPNERCDLFRGEWIQDPSDPPYTNNTCRFISYYQNCLMNGRPDLGYLHWRWKPHCCDFRPSLLQDFLDAMLGKSLGFVGDSLLRNQAESLVCMLSQVEEPAYEFVRSLETNIWYFSTYNFTITHVLSRHLLKSVEPASGNILKIYLDVLDARWVSQYRNFDYVEIGTGSWFRRAFLMLEDNKIVACNDCQLANVTQLGYLHAYRRALRLSFRFVMSEPGHMPRLVLHRSVTPEHFEHGSGRYRGYCNMTVPYKEGEFEGHVGDRAMEAIGQEEFADAVAGGDVGGGGGRMRYMDVYHLSLLRPDGHPGRYPVRKEEYLRDCLHWCLPGPVDTWTYLMMEMILSEHDGSSRRSS